MKGILCLSTFLLLVAYSCSATALTKPVNDTYFNSICVAEDRLRQMCTLLIADGCICYNNGTCMKQWVNKCIDCGKENVFAVIYGPCPDVHPYLCGPKTLAPVNAESIQGCVCTKDGECVEKTYEQSKQCQSTNDLAYFSRLACPAESLQVSQSEKEAMYKAVVCTPELRNSKIACADVVRYLGCVTYSDGSKSYVPVNSCTCQQPNVVQYAMNRFCE